MTTSEMASRTVATAAADVRLSFSMLLRMRTDVTSVRSGRLPDNSTSEPYSLMARANAVVEAVLHQGACSDTTERNGHYMLDNNYQVTLELFELCQAFHFDLEEHVWRSDFSRCAQGRFNSACGHDVIFLDEDTIM